MNVLVAFCFLAVASYMYNNKQDLFTNTVLLVTIGYFIYSTAKYFIS